VLQRLGKQGRKFGGLMMEPVILGAGGMIFVYVISSHHVLSSLTSLIAILCFNGHS
jgi:hypothetical protein